MELWITWLIVIIILSFIEACTVNLVSIWFIVSALISLAMSFFDIPFVWQFATFVLLGILLMIITKPLLKKYIHPKSVKTNIDRVIGMTGIVTEEITKNTIGEIKVDGKRWSAMSKESITVGENVIIDEIDGVKLKVHKHEEK
ncbi:MAG: NfeD family protein [Bacilli bacterium]|nr:NfeD family protein [Bacilli bacterium]